MFIVFINSFMLCIITLYLFSIKKKKLLLFLSDISMEIIYITTYWVICNAFLDVKQYYSFTASIITLYNIKYINK